MKNRALVWLLVVGLAVGFLVLPVTPSYAWSHGHGRVFIGVAPGFWWGPPYPYYWYPPPYYPQIQNCPEPWVRVPPRSQ